MYSQANAANEPGSAANATNDGADPERHDPANVRGQRTRLGLVADPHEVVDHVPAPCGG
jgi:hypothetical protein